MSQRSKEAIGILVWALVLFLWMAFALNTNGQDLKVDHLKVVNQLEFGATPTISAELITGQTEEGSIAADDVLLIYDTSATALRKVQVTNLPTGDTLPVDDSTAVVRDPADNTKLIRLDAGSLSTAATRVLSMPDADVNLGALTAANLAADSVTASEIATGAVSLDELNAGAITGQTEEASPASGDFFLFYDTTAGALRKLDYDNLPGGGGVSLPVSDATSLVEDPVDGTKEMRIDVGTVSTATVRVLTMPDADVNLGALTAANLAADSVTASEIASNAVDSDEIAANAVGSSEIAANAVGTSEIATDGVDADEIAANAVGTSELASTAVTPGSYTHASITVDADGRLTAASSGTVSLQKYRVMKIPAAAFKPDDTNPPEFSGDALGDWYAFDQSTDEILAFTIALHDWDGGTLKAKFDWETTVASGNVVWAVEIGSADDNEAATAGTTVVSVTDGSNGAGDRNLSAASSAITPDGSAAAGHLLYIEIRRDADNGSDTLAGDAKLRAVYLQYQEASSFSAW